MAPAMKTLLIGTINKGGQGQNIYSVNGHASTQTANSGGGGAKCGLYLVGDRVRRPTITEVKRIMSFPDDHIVDDVEGVARKQLGNAVCPKVIEHIWRGIDGFGV